MADKSINQLPSVNTMKPEDLLVLQQDNMAKKMSGNTLSNYLGQNIVNISSTQPTESVNKIWITPSNDEYELAEQSEVDELKTALTATISEEDYFAIPFVIDSSNGFINQHTGEVVAANSYRHTDYVDLSNFVSISYKRIGITQGGASAAAGGIAFYDAQKTYISGVQAVRSQPTVGYITPLYTYTIPNNAVYARFSTLPSETYGDFELYGKSKLKNDIDTIKTNISGINTDLGKVLTLDVNKSTAITSGADLNDYTTVGNYHIANSTTAINVENMPDQNPGKLIVLTTATTNNIAQFYLSTLGNIYARKRDASGWSDWQYIVFSQEETRLSSMSYTYYNYLAPLMKEATYNLAFANSPAPIPMLNYLGNTQNVHPKVLYFPNGFGGYLFWMAYTPYPNGNDLYENPCIARSNDGYTWIGISSNPLDNPNGDGYDSDTHLVYRSDTETLECWYRYVYEYSTDVRREKIYRQTSTNGTTWSAKELVLDSQTNGATHYLSPSIIWDGEKYNMWVVDNNVVKYYTALGTAITTWTLVHTYSSLSFVDGSTATNPWHLDVIDDNGTYVMVVMCQTNGDKSIGKWSLFITTSTDNATYTTPVKVLEGSSGSWDEYIYRSSIVKTGSIYRIYYSAFNKDNVTGMAVTLSNSLTNFIGKLV